MSFISTDAYISHLVHKENKKVECYKFFDLSLELGISERGLRDKRNNNSFTRDECLFMAVRFQMTVENLNELLFLNNNHTLGITDRDGIIRKCLYEHKDIYETDELLTSNGFEGFGKYAEYPEYDDE